MCDGAVQDDRQAQVNRPTVVTTTPRPWNTPSAASRTLAVVLLSQDSLVTGVQLSRSFMASQGPRTGTYRRSSPV